MRLCAAPRWLISQIWVGGLGATAWGAAIGQPAGVGVWGNCREGGADVSYAGRPARRAPY